MAAMTVGEVKNWLKVVRLRRIVFLGRQQGFAARRRGPASRRPCNWPVTGSGKMRQGHGPEAAEAGEYAPFIGSGRPLLPLDGLQRADGGDDVAGLGFFAAGDDGRCGGRVGSFHGVISSLASAGPASRGLSERPDRRRDGLFAHRLHQCGRCPPQPEKRKVHSSEKHGGVKAVCPVAAGGSGCNVAGERPRPGAQRRRKAAAGSGRRRDSAAGDVAGAGRLSAARPGG